MTDRSVEPEEEAVVEGPSLNMQVHFMKLTVCFEMLENNIAILDEPQVAMLRDNLNQWLFMQAEKKEAKN